MHTITPTEPLHQVVIHRCYCNWAMPKWFARIILHCLAVQVTNKETKFINETKTEKHDCLLDLKPIQLYLLFVVGS